MLQQQESGEVVATADGGYADLAADVLALAQRAGATAADIVVADGDTFSVQVRVGAVEETITRSLSGHIVHVLGGVSALEILTRRVPGRAFGFEVGLPLASRPMSEKSPPLQSSRSGATDFRAA